MHRMHQCLLKIVILFSYQMHSRQTRSITNLVNVLNAAGCVGLRPMTDAVLPIPVPIQHLIRTDLLQPLQATRKSTHQPGSTLIISTFKLEIEEGPDTIRVPGVKAAVGSIPLIIKRIDVRLSPTRT